MAGFLAPQINEIGAARGGSAPPADTSVGDALTGVAKIFDAFAGLKAPTVTQKDRDSARLQPFMRLISRIESQRDKLGPAQHGARINSAFSSAAVANPTLIAELRTGVAAITGLEIGTAEINLAQQITDTTIDWLTNDSEGVALAPGLMVYDDNGEVDSDLTILNALRARSQVAADDAELTRLNTQLGIEQARSGIDEVRLKGVVDEWLFKFGNQAQEHFQGIVRGALATGATVVDGVTVLAQLRDQRAQLANRFESKARAGGFANHPDWDVSIALSSYDNAIAALTDKQEDITRIFETLRSMDSISLGNAINGIMGVGGFQRDFSTYLLSNMAIAGSSQFAELAKELRASKTLGTLADRPLFTPEATPVNKENPPVEGGSATTEAQAAAADLSRDERQEEVKFGLANFGSYLTENAKDESYRTTAVKGFTLASLAMTTSPQPVSVATFDKMYDTKFFDTYKSVVGFGDEVAGKLQNEVTHNLAVIFSQREKLARTRLANSFSSLPSFGLTFTDGKVGLAFNAFGPGSTELEKSILSRLDQLGLPRTLDGVLELGAGFLTPAGFGPNLANLKELNKEIVYLNKIVSTISRLPDLSEHLLPKIEEGFTTRPVFNTVEEYNSTYPNLPHGQEYFVVGEGGGLTLEKKGFESFLFKGTKDE